MSELSGRAVDSLVLKYLGRPSRLAADRGSREPGSPVRGTATPSALHGQEGDASLRGPRDSQRTLAVEELESRGGSARGSSRNPSVGVGRAAAEKASASGGAKALPPASAGASVPSEGPRVTFGPSSASGASQGGGQAASSQSKSSVLSTAHLLLEKYPSKPGAEASASAGRSSVSEGVLRTAGTQTPHPDPEARDLGPLDALVEGIDSLRRAITSLHADVVARFVSLERRVDALEERLGRRLDQLF